MARVDLKDAARLMRRAWPACALAMLALPTVLGARAALAATPAPPVVVVSPLNGSPDADPHSQISFLGAPGSDLRDIVVTGSRSGTHAGRLVNYSTHNGGSFLPSKPFTPGETVTVSANL